LYQKLGDFEPALTWAERALEADPEDAYSFYLQGRALRLTGEYAAAEAALKEALRLHDDFVHAIGELAALYASQSGGTIVAVAELADSARRYADHAVSLSPQDRAEFYEFQGLCRFVAADPRGAAAAFTRAREAATADADKLFARGALAVVDYSRGRVDDAVAVLLRLVEDLTKDDPVRVWADATVNDIDKHAQKEMLTDRFERSDVGSIWPGQRDGGLGAKVVDGRLTFRGKFSRGGEVSVERTSAVKKGKNFLAVGVTMQLGPSHMRSAGFAGLRIMTQQGANGRTDSRIEVGLRDGEPFLRVIDNRETKQFDLAVDGFDIDAEQKLVLRVLPQGEDRGRAFVLQVSWNDQVVHGQEIKSLSGATQTELRTVLFVDGSRGSSCDVSFDDYQLERNKE